MKLPGKVRSMIDEMGLSSKEKTAVLRHLNDMADSLPEHPTPAEAKRIVDGALKKVGAGKKDDEEKPKKEKEEKKEEKKEDVKESKMSFKSFLMEFSSGEFDDSKTNKAAQKVQAALDTRFQGYFDQKRNKDSSITFVQKGGAHQHDANNDYVLSPQNLTKIIGPIMDNFRKQGWTFTQSVSGEFTIGLPADANLANLK